MAPPALPAYGRVVIQAPASRRGQVLLTTGALIERIFYLANEDNPRHRPLNPPLVGDLAAIIGCVCLFGMTFSLYTPLLSLILEARGASRTLIGSLAMAPALGVILGSFFVPLCLQKVGGRGLLLAGVIIEIVLILFLMSSDSFGWWFAIRFLGGFSGTIVFVVSETWLNEVTPDAIRGRVIGLYNTMLALSFAIGPLILSLTGIRGLLPFIVGVGLMLVAAVPLFVVRRYEPGPRENSSFGIIGFTRVAPLLVMACFVVAFKEMASVGLLPVYGVRSGLSESMSALMLFYAAVGGAVLQFPIGWLSDHFNRVAVMAVCGVAGIAGAVVLPFVVGVPWLLWLTLFLWMGLFAGVYTIALTLAGQWFRGMDLATAMASFGVFWGLGGLAGPMLSGYCMDLWNPHGLPLALGLAGLCFVIMTVVPSLRAPPRTLTASRVAP